MTAVALPSTPGPSSISWSVVDFGSTIRGAGGGSAQRKNKLGNRWMVTVSMPPMGIEDAEQWAFNLTRGLRDGVTWEVRQHGNVSTPSGTVRVAGAGQTGTEIDLDGFTPGYVVKFGQWFAIETSSQLYLYKSGTNVLVGAGGTATLQLEPVLRVSPADNDLVRIGPAVMQGILTGPPKWDGNPAKLTSGFDFSIEETK